MTSFAGQRVVESGGNGGIGKCIAKCVVDAGAWVVVGSRNVETLSAAALAIGAQNAALDVRDWHGTKSFAETATEKLGGIDVGVNSAAVEEMAFLREHAPDHVARIAAIQFNGAVHFMQQASNVMLDGGNLVNMASLTGSIAAPGYIAHGGAKAGVLHALQVAALERPAVEFA
jgi:3-oxoacyl-[acyl-carrier protein] reductase